MAVGEGEEEEREACAIRKGEETESGGGGGGRKTEGKMRPFPSCLRWWRIGGRIGGGGGGRPDFRFGPNDRPKRSSPSSPLHGCQTDTEKECGV